MAVALLVDNPEGSQETYEQVRAQLDADQASDRPERVPQLLARVVA